MFNKFYIFAFLAFCIFSLPAAAAPPANDNFANAQVISGMNGQSVVVNNLEATKEASEPAHALNKGGKSVWYKYTATGSGSLEISTGLSFFDTLLAVYEGTSLSNLKLVAANDNIEEAQFSCTCSRLRVGTMTGKTYYIAVDGKSAPNGIVSNGDITVSFELTNAPPNDNFANAVFLPFASAKLKTTTNVGASKELGEPNHAGNAGGKSVWFKWTAPAGVQKTYDFTVRSVGVIDNVNTQTMFAIYTGSSVGSLTEIARGEDYFYSKIVFSPVPGATYYLAIDGFDGGQGAAQVTTTLTYGVYKTDKMPDVDHDGKADLTVFRPTTGTWYALESSSEKMRAYQWGTNGDKPLVADYDRDGELDYTVFRPDTGVWYVRRSTIQSMTAFNWGLNIDIPMLRELHAANGLNSRRATVFRPSEGVWYQNVGGGLITQFGLPGDVPALADFTGDGVDDLTVFRPSNVTWYILLDQNTQEYRAVQFGTGGDHPVPADYDADGRTDIAVYRPSTGVWYVLRSSDGGFQAAQFGIASDKPQPADYDGDGKADYAVFRSGVWWILQSSNNQARVAQFGLSSDLPLTAQIN